MFNRSYLLGACLLASIAALLLWQITAVHPGDLDRYRTLLASTQEETSPQAPKQHRENVRKDIWISNAGGRLHYQIECHASSLEWQGELTEHMEGVRGMMQEALLWVLPGGKEVTCEAPGMYRVCGSGQLLFQATPGRDWIAMQELRWLETDKASYFYKRKHCVTEQAKLLRLRTLGHELISSPEGLDPMMKGTARSAELFLTGHGIDFRADHLKATVYHGGGVL